MTEAAEILTTARSGNVPSNWIVLPLRRNQVGFDLLQWALGALMGLGLFLGLFFATWPDNFEHGAPGIVITSFILVLLGFLGFGSLWLLVRDALRWLKADQSIIVLTPDIYLKQDGKKIDLVPLEEIGYITTRGAKAPSKRSSWATYNSTPEPDYDPEDRQIASAGLVSQYLGGRRKKPRGPTSVAFVDLRTDKKVNVTSDNSYAHPYELGETLHAYVEARLRKMDEEARKPGVT